MTEYSVPLLVSMLGFVGLLVPALLLHSREKRKMEFNFKETLKERDKKLKKAQRKINEFEIKTTLFDKIMDISSVKKIEESVERIFKDTTADRFLIIIAVNGLHGFNAISVIFEQHKSAEYNTHAIARYRNVKIDDVYREMLKQTEKTDYVVFNTESETDSLLKDIYELEGINHSLIKHIARKPVNEEDDFLVYSSVSTHNIKKYTKKERTLINREYEGSIKPSINKVLN